MLISSDCGEHTQLSVLSPVTWLALISLGLQHWSELRWVIPLQAVRTAATPSPVALSSAPVQTLINAVDRKKGGQYQGLTDLDVLFQDWDAMFSLVECTFSLREKNDIALGKNISPSDI